MIAHKLGRIVNGDPNYADSWDDIAGYAKLVSDELSAVQGDEDFMQKVQGAVRMAVHWHGALAWVDAVKRTSTLVKHGDLTVGVAITFQRDKPEKEDEQ